MQSSFTLSEANVSLGICEAAAESRRIAGEFATPPHNDLKPLCNKGFKAFTFYLWLLALSLVLLVIVLPACRKENTNSTHSLRSVQANAANSTNKTIPPVSQSPIVPIEQSSPVATSVSTTNYTYYLVARIVDGDTIVLEDKTKVRFIGIDTPPSRNGKELDKAVKRTGKDRELIKKLGKEASDFTKKLCAGKKVYLEYDVRKIDPFKRTLAYVYLEDGTFVNAYLVEQGYACVSTYPPNVKYQEKFIELERKAKEEKRGLWGQDK